MFYDVYVELCHNNGKSPSAVAQELGINKSNVSNWKNNGYTPRGAVLNKIAEYFGVSVDYLLGKEQKEKPTLTAKDERDIARDLERIRDALENEETIMFDGDPMSDEARDSIMNAIALGLQAAKLKNKEKYTPKKYRKG